MDSSGAVPANRIKVSRGDIRAIAANQVGVSAYKIQAALNIKKTDPEVFGQVKRGEVTVGAALQRMAGKTEAWGKRGATFETLLSSAPAPVWSH